MSLHRRGAVAAGVMHNDVYYVPCADLGNPNGCVDDPDELGGTAILTVTERDND